MAIVTYGTYVPDVSVYATGCPNLTIVDALRKTAIEFFTESLAYRSWVTAFDLTISTTTYSIAAKCPTETEVAQIMALFCEGVAVQELTHEQFLARDPEWPSLTGTNAQFYTILNNKDSFNIIPIPDATIASAMTMQLAVAPTLASTGVEQVYFEEWKDFIVAGALARVLRIPERPWTNIKESAVYYSMYLNGRLRAKIQASKGNLRRDTTVQLRRWV